MKVGQCICILLMLTTGGAAQSPPAPSAAARELAVRLIGENGDAPEPLESHRGRFDVDLRRALTLEANRLSAAGRVDEALRGYDLARQVAEAIGDRVGASSAAIGAGMTYGRRGDYAQAADALRRGLSIAEAVGDQGNIQAALNNLGVVLKLQGEYEAALDYYARSLALADKLGQQGSVARTLTNIGGVHLLRGSYRDAVEFFQRSAQLKEQTKQIGDLDGTLGNLGTAYMRMGDDELALEYFTRAVEVQEQVRDRVAHFALHNIARFHLERHRYDLALDYLQRARASAEAADDKAELTSILTDEGTTRRALADLDGAMRDFERALAIGEAINDRQGVADALVEIAATERERGRFAQGLSQARRASQLAIELGSRETMWHARDAEGVLHAALGDAAATEDAYRDAIDVIEQIRADAGGGAAERSAFLASRLSPFHDLTALLVAKKRTADALTIAERAKARVLLDVLQGARADARLLTADERERERQLERAVSAAHARLQAEAAKEAPDRDALARLRAAWADARLAGAELRTTLYRAHPELQLSRGDAAPGSFADAAAMVADTHTAIVEFVVAPEETVLFVVSRRADGTPTLRAFTIPIADADLTKEVERFRMQLADRDLDFQATALGLYRRLLGPADAALRGATDLVIVPDGALWSLPFQALQPRPKRYLIEDAAVSFAPSIAVLREMRRRRASAPSTALPSLVAFGDPATAGADRLPDLAAQVRRLREIYGPEHSRVFVGGDASEDRFTSAAGGATVLHLATHGVLDAANPMYSFLQLARGADNDSGHNGRLEAWEIMRANVRADVTVLAACETARGRIGGGEGVIGLSWAFFLAGSPRTVVSLWKVDAASTTDLMIAFHRQLRAGMIRRPGNPRTAASLRAASLALLGDARYRHPFYWAGFLVVGDGS